jgi:hypothetical protein
LWSLHTSDAISNIIKDSYKQNRHDDDLNQPLSVQHWGKDAQKRRYWLIEGKDDTPFRLYRESNPAQKRNTWWSVAGSIDELRVIAEKLAGDGSQAGRRLSERITNALPRFEATEEVSHRLLLIVSSLTISRNANVGSIGSLAKCSLLDLNRGFPCTKAVLEANGCDTLSVMMKTTSPCLILERDHAARLVTLEL